jgi:hypothetical protein
MKKLFIVFAALCLAVPAMAADWNFYGSARFATFYTDLDFDIPGTDDRTNLEWNQQGNSRIGANVKFNDEIGGRFEMSDNFGKRLLFGTYNFGAGQLLLGQTYNPSSSYFYSNSVFDGDGGLLGLGQFYDGRNPMVQLSFGRFKMAAITQNTPDTLGGTDVEKMLPKLEGSYGYRADTWFFDVFGGYQTYEVIGTPIGDQDIDAYVIGVGGGVNFGPISFKAGLNLGQNYGNYGQWNRGGTNPIRNTATILNGQVEDVDNWGFLGVLGFKASDMLAFEAGYGWTQAEVDVAGGYKDELTQIYVNSTINITKGFFIVPEVGTIMYEGRVNEPELFYLGAKWQINF